MKHLVSSMPAEHHGPAGLTRSVGVLIATERFSERTEDVVPLVLHELAHFQQALVQGVDTYRRIYGSDQTLLALALREGSADLIAELTTGRHSNLDAERCGLSHERALWQRFREDMHDREPGDWMFVQPRTPSGRPTWDTGWGIGSPKATTTESRTFSRRCSLSSTLRIAMPSLRPAGTRSGWIDEKGNKAAHSRLPQRILRMSISYSPIRCMSRAWSQSRSTVRAPQPQT